MTAVDNWNLARYSKKFTAVAFIDLTKALDSVRHDVLLQTLQQYGFGGTVLKWFQDYLQDREQFIKLQEPPLTFVCTKGVPQGSVLGPLLFNIYVADLGNIAQEGGTSLPSFADDFTLYASRLTADAACRAVSNVLTTLYDTLKHRGLRMNCEKTVAMVIPPTLRTTAETKGCRITCGTTELKLVDECRLLGIVIDSALSWKAQVDHLCSKVGRKIGALKRSFRQLSPYARRSFLISVIQPDFEYASIVYVPCMMAGLRNRLEAVWRRAVRCAGGSGYQENIAPLLEDLKMTNIRTRWILQYAIFVRRCHRKQAPSSVCNKLTATRHSHSTRGSKHSYRPLRPSTNAGCVSFSNRAPLLWNALPSDVQDEPSLSTFKRKCLSMLEEHVKHTFFDSVCLNNPSDLKPLYD